MFLIKSTILEKLHPAISTVVAAVKTAIDERRPILIRHHADADGFSAGIALERGIKPLLDAKHSRERDLFYYYMRLPLLAPSYTYEDATKDADRAAKNMIQFGMKAPLLIICDTGSGADSVAGIRKATLYGASVIIIDHHPPCQDIDTLVLAHVNPHNVGSTYDFCAGMLCAEIAHQITAHMKNLPHQHLEFIAAVSAVADRVASKEAEHYRKIAIEKGFPAMVIDRIAAALDFEAQTLGPFAGSVIMQDLLGAHKTKQLKLLVIIEKQMKPVMEIQLQSCLHYATVQKKKDFTFVIVPIADAKHRGTYPGRGKSISIVLDHFMTKGDAIAIGIGAGSINFRCSTAIKAFDVNAIIAACQKRFPYAQVQGGGHRVAGTMSFIPASQEEVLDFVKEYVDGL